MALKKALSCLIATGILLSNISAFADEICDYDYFFNSMVELNNTLSTNEKTTEIPNGYDEYSKTLLEAAEYGIVDLNELDTLSGNVIKQDAISYLYKILLRADKEYEITEKQADEILNTCYDNAYIKEENKIAYASMIRHGIISSRTLTEPNKVLTTESVDILKKRVSAQFEKKLPVSIGEKKISIGSSIDEMYANFGDPSRIDKSEFGFDWYVFNTYYSDFIMIGVKDDVVCAYYTNAKNFEFDGIKSGESTNYSSNDKNLSVFYDSNNKVDAVWYNPFSVSREYDYEALNLEFLDIINAYRVKNGLLSLIEPADEFISQLIESENSTKLSASVLANNPLEAYLKLFQSDEGINILTSDFGISTMESSEVQITDSNKKNIWNITITEPNKALLAKLKNKISYNDVELEEKLNSIKTPEIISPESDSTYTEDMLKLTLKKRCSDKYFVKLFNLETESYDVYAYISTNKKHINIPSYILTKGNKYRVTICAVSEEKELTGNTIEFTYGKCEIPLAIQSPAKNLSTYDDELEFSAYSSAYRDFRVDVYDTKNNNVYSQVLYGTGESILPSLPVGKYYVCVTAICHATGKDVTNSFSTVEIKKIVPIIKEIILEPGQKYNYYYGDGKDWIYFYDTETIAVTEDKIVTVPVDDMNGEPDPAEKLYEKSTKKSEESASSTTETSSPAEATSTPVASEKPNEENPNKDKLNEDKPTETEKTETVTVYKTKIIQRKVPATKRFRALAGFLPERTYTTGAFIAGNKNATPTEKGNAIAALALSYQGIPYLWGGISPSGFDCSGLVKYVCNSLGIKNVARTSAEQYAYSGVFVDKKDLVPGDLVFFSENGVIHHVGIYIGANMMVHSPHTGDVVKVSSLSDSYYMREYAGAKRVTQ